AGEPAGLDGSDGAVGVGGGAVMAATFTEAEVLARVEGLTDDQAKAVVCALVGHSRIQDHCFGYYTCARCGAQLGDALGGVYSAANRAVVVGHDCPVCRENAKELTWRDTLMAPDPFDENKVAEQREAREYLQRRVAEERES